MLSSVNPFGGLSAADISMLFGASSSSSSSSTTSSSAAQSASAGVSASGANDPFTAIKTILAQAQIGPSVGGGSAISVTAEAAYAAQAGGSSSLVTANVTVALPGALQQINDAVSLINNLPIYSQIGNVSNPITVTASDAVNINISNGSVSMAATQDSVVPSELPSWASIQQALGELKSEDQTMGWNGVEATPESTAKDVATAWWNSISDGSSFTLVKLPPGALGASGGNTITFSATGDDNNKWQLVLPQTSVSVTVSDTQINN